MKTKKDIKTTKQYELLKGFYELGQTDIPSVVGDVNLENWISHKRVDYKNGKLDTYEIESLNEIGFVWDKYEVAFNLKFDKLNAYYQKNGNLDVRVRSELGGMINDFRKAKSNNKLSAERIGKLESIGMTWTPRDEAWNTYFEICKNFNQKYDNLFIPLQYVENGLNVGKWLSHQRNARVNNILSQDKIERLESIGMTWEKNTQQQTSFAEQALCFYLEKAGVENESRFQEFGFELDAYLPQLHIGIEYDGKIGHADVERDLLKNQKAIDNNITLIRVREDGCPDLEEFGITCLYRNGNSNESLEKVLRELFEMLNITFDDFNIGRDCMEIQDRYTVAITKTWNDAYAIAKAYYTKNGNLRVPCRTEYEGFKLGRWIARQREAMKNVNGMRLTSQKIEKLESIGMVWAIK